MKRVKLLTIALLLMVGNASMNAEIKSFGSSEATSWAATSADGCSMGSTVTLDGVVVTLGSPDDTGKNWTWNAKNAGLVPDEMPSTGGTAETLVTSFSTTNPFGDLPTHGCFLKIEPTKDGTITIGGKPSTDGSQKLVFVTTDKKNPATILSATVSSNSGSSWNYSVDADHVYYFFQLSYTGMLTAYRFTLKGFSFSPKQGPKNFGDGSETSWIPTSADGCAMGSTVTLDGATFTLGGDEDQNWAWNAGNGGLLPSQMPSTDGTVGTLVTKASFTETPVLPTHGAFLKIVPTKTCTVTIRAKASANPEQPLIFVTMDKDDNILSSQVTDWITDFYTIVAQWTYDVDADHHYCFFQASYEGIGYNRLTLCGLYTQTVATRIGETGFTTFASPHPLDLCKLPDGLTAYKASAIGANTVTFSPVTEAVAAGTGLLLKGNKGNFYSIPVANAAEPLADNKLVGCTAETVLEKNENFWVLVSNEGTAEFQKLSENGATIPAGKAYLNAAAAGARLSIVFDDDVTTGVIEIVNSKLSNSKYFDLQGRRVAQPQKGLYIVNGKKVFVN